MDLKRLRYFCAIVEHGQISKAAQALNIAQPPLSLRLKELEEEFGVTLIKRGNRQCEVTEAGRCLYERARMVLSEIDDLTEDLKRAEGEPSYIVIGVSSTCASFLRAPLQQICATHPHVRLRVLLGDSTWLENMIRQRCVDFAIMQTPEDEKGLVLDPLPVCRFLVLVPDSLSEVFGRPERVTMETIAPFPLLLLRRSSGSGFYEKFVRLFHARGLTPRIIMDCPDVRVLRDACSSGMQAITLLPESEARDYQPYKGRFFLLEEPEIVFHPMIGRLSGQRASRDVMEVISYILTGEQEPCAT